ncbi:tyrosine-type recombinase/integrase [Methylobacillus gramineus]|uniref:phage integrase n=1 Tax=Methylobacillus gramineus TaxID=755169 RepID=UPI001D0002FF|nr:tyrosine-type recombinase/integrase [Methylobacillus gramineus]MCB5186128.1 tyrosine-type recombinase/integrase [Methylobacillus gramineus]
MSIKKTPSGWLADIQPGGRGAKRFRKTFTTKAEALAWEAWLKTQINQTPEWLPQKKDTRRLKELIDLWYKHHGSQLRSGKDTYQRLLAMATAMSNPTADTFTAAMFASYRTKRIETGVTANNMNREHAYLRAVFNELRRVGEWAKENPLRDLRQFRLEERELSYLNHEQIKILLGALQPRQTNTYLVAKICLSTGARWSEAEQLRASQIKNNQIHFTKTKSGKNRTIPITQDLVDEIANRPLKGFGMRLFKDCYEDFRRCIAILDIDLPQGQLTHVLRHTFASHFMMNGGNILTLQRILGHSSITMTMKYAHLAPEHLQDAKRYNPLLNL